MNWSVRIHLTNSLGVSQGFVASVKPRPHACVSVYILKKTKLNNFSAKLAFSNLSPVQTNPFSFDSASYFFFVFTYLSNTLKRPKTLMESTVVYSTANDPRPQMIPRPEMIPKLDSKWSRIANDLRCGPQMISADKRGMAWSLISWIFYFYFYSFSSTKRFSR